MSGEFLVNEQGKKRRGVLKAFLRLSGRLVIRRGFDTVELAGIQEKGSRRKLRDPCYFNGGPKTVRRRLPLRILHSKLSQRHSPHSSSSPYNEQGLLSPLYGSQYVVGAPFALSKQAQPAPLLIFSLVTVQRGKGLSSPLYGAR